MAELNDREAIDIALEYYGQKFNARDTAKIVASLSRVGIIGLIQYSYEQGTKSLEIVTDIEDYWKSQHSRAER